MDRELKLRGNAEQFENIYCREACRGYKINKESRTIKGVLTTEDPVIVWDMARWEPIREVLLIDGMEVPEKMPMLNVHSRFELSDIKGSVLNSIVAREDNKKIVESDFVFSSLARDEWTLAEEGHLDSTSIGYEVYPKESIVIRPGQRADVNGKTYENNFGDDFNLVIRKKSRVFEGSLVVIGANRAAKFRSAFVDNPLTAQRDNETIEKLNNKIIELDNKINVIKINEGNRKMELDPKLIDQQRRDSIDKLAVDFKDQVKGLDLMQLRDLYKDGDKSVNDFSNKILENIERQASVAKPTIDIPKKLTAKYSIQRAIAHLLDPKKGDCLEMEISRAYQEASGIQSNGFVIPHNLMNEKAQYLKRDVSTTATAGGEFVPTDHLGGEWIDTLKNDTIAAQLGVRFLPGRKGDISIPKLTTGNTFGWAATENAVVLESTPVTTAVTMSPKRGGFFVDLSKQAILQSDPALDSVLTEDGRMVMAIGLDQGFFHGAGSGGAFTGIAATTNVQTVNASSLDWLKALDYAKKVKVANAALGELKFAFNPTVEAALMGRAKESGYPVYIIGEDGKMAGRPYLVSNQISDNYLFFGAWNQAYMALWDGIDVTVDPYTLATYHLVRIVFNQLADCAVRYPQAFVVSSDFS